LPLFVLPRWQISFQWPPGSLPCYGRALDNFLYLFTTDWFSIAYPPFYFPPCPSTPFSSPIHCFHKAEGNVLFFLHCPVCLLGPCSFPPDPRHIITVHPSPTVPSPVGFLFAVILCIGTSAFCRVVAPPSLDLPSLLSFSPPSKGRFFLSARETPPFCSCFLPLLANRFFDASPFETSG